MTYDITLIVILVVVIAFVSISTIGFVWIGAKDDKRRSNRGYKTRYSL